jgi:ketosteroid isomerase-like protein
MATTRSSQEVFNHHAQALGAEDLEEIVADYSDDAVFITPAGVQRGKDGVRQAVTKLLEDGIDTFVFRDGLIRVQTASATAAARSLTGGKCHAPGC